MFLYFMPSSLCSFPVFCPEQDVEFDCIGSWSLPFHPSHCMQVIQVSILLGNKGNKFTH